MTEKTTKTEKKPADWELIERHYRAGQLSLREICKAADDAVTEGAIRKRAKKDGWTRNLKDKIAQRAEELVRKEAVRKESTQLTPASEKEVVEANADLIYQVRMEHRKDIKDARALFQTLLSEVAGITARPDLCEELFELLHKDDSTADADDPRAVAREEGRLFKMRQAFERVMSIAGRVDAAKKLSEMLERLIKLEREAFGIGAEDDKTNSIDEMLLELHREQEAKRA